MRALIPTLCNCWSNESSRRNTVSGKITPRCYNDNPGRPQEVRYHCVKVQHMAPLLEIGRQNLPASLLTRDRCFHVRKVRRRKDYSGPYYSSHSLLHYRCGATLFSMLTVEEKKAIPAWERWYGILYNVILGSCLTQVQESRTPARHRDTLPVRLL